LDIAAPQAKRLDGCFCKIFLKWLSYCPQPSRTWAGAERRRLSYCYQWRFFSDFDL